MPVEGYTGRAVSGSATSKVEPVASSSKSDGAMKHQINSLQSSTGNASSDQLVSRTQGLRLRPSTTDSKSKGTTVSNQRQPVPYDESFLSLFGLVSSDSLVNPSKRISFLDTKSPNSFMGFNEKEASNQYPVHHFMDDWPKTNADQNSTSWGRRTKIRLDTALNVHPRCS